MPPEEKTDFMAPFRRKADFGGVVAFPLMVPVKPTDKYVEDFRNARIFLGKFPKTINIIFLLEKEPPKGFCIRNQGHHA